MSDAENIENREDVTELKRKQWPGCRSYKGKGKLPRCAGYGHS
jgi:hypothetical protein